MRERAAAATHLRCWQLQGGGDAADHLSEGLGGALDDAAGMGIAAAGACVHHRSEPGKACGPKSLGDHGGLQFLGSTHSKDLPELLF